MAADAGGQSVAVEKGEPRQRSAESESAESFKARAQQEAVAVGDFRDIETATYSAKHIGDPSGRWVVTEKRNNIPCRMFGSRVDIQMKIAKMAEQGAVKASWNQRHMYSAARKSRLNSGPRPKAELAD